MLKNILLDTNMLIYLEDDHEINAEVAKLTRIIYDSNDFRIVIHPNTLLEANKIKDEKRKRIFKSKISTYKLIDRPPKATEKFHKLVGFNNENDRIDNDMLFAVKQNCASYFITNDIKLKKKSKKIGLQNKVLGIKEAITKFEVQEKKNVFTPVFIQNEYLYQIEIEDEFFDSLRNDYKDFNIWFKKKQEQKEQAYVSRDRQNKITSFLMLKIEDENEQYKDFNKPFIPAKRLKVSTFKVDDIGKRIGETFIKIIMEKAIQEKVDEIYVTAFKKHERLIDLLNEYGFRYYSYKYTPNQIGEMKKEDIFVRNMKNKKYYPFIQVNNQRIFLIPIQPNYHKLLFPEAINERQIEISDYEGTNSASNAIGKAYISNANINKIQKDDILLFYASQDIKAVTSIGIVDATFSSFENYKEIANLVNKRTAYSDEQLKDSVFNNSLVIMFKHYMSFKKQIDYKWLLDNKIVTGPIQCPKEISQDDFIKIVSNNKEDINYFEIN